MELRQYKKLTKASLAAALLFVTCVCWNLYSLYRLPMVSNAHTTFIVSIESAASAAEFVHALKKNGCIASSTLYLALIRIHGWTHQLQAGIYDIKPGESAMQLLHRVIAGHVMTHNFTIIAGSTMNKVAKDVLQSPHLMFYPDYWQHIQQEHLSAEGLLLADTYQYAAGSSNKRLLEQAHAHLLQVLHSIWSSREPNLPYKTPYELLIAASIIEKESAVPAERKLIAGIVMNRLNKGMPLQMDPTVIYGLESAYKGKLSHNDLLIDSPYNSYKYKGLPPTPIAMVGQEAIMAAAHPAFSNFLYFVAKGDGTHQFSETYVQQRQAIHQYQRKDT